MLFGVSGVFVRDPERLVLRLMLEALSIGGLAARALLNVLVGVEVRGVLRSRMS